MTPAPRRAALAVGLACLAAGLGTVAAPATAAPVSVHEVYPVPPNGVYTLSGHGFGHGRGMSQFGAYGAALDGLTAAQIVAFYYPNTSLSSGGPATVRVLLHRAQGVPLTIVPRSGVATKVSTTVAGVADCTLPTSFDGGKTTVRRWRAKLVSTTSGERLRLQKTTDGTTWSNAAITGCAAAWSQPMNGSITFSSGALVKVVDADGGVIGYRGVVRAAFTGTTVYPVNIVALESYLRSVVPSEMPSSWSDAALQAQAIAARTYAADVAAHPRMAAYFDLYDDTRDQMYTGVGSEVSSTDSAITATAGKVLRDSYGHLIFAQFSSSSGGWTVDGGTPYLTAHSDPYDGVPKVSWSPHSWTTTVSASTIRAVYPSVGTLQSVVVTGRDGNGQWGGRVTTMTIHGSSGSVTTTGPEFRSALGLRSEWFRIVLPPNAPRYVRATRNGTSATVTWAAPTANGGSPVTGYRVVLQPGSIVHTASASATSLQVTGLNASTHYTVSVAATSAVGPGRAGVVTDKLRRLGGSDRTAIAVAVSKATFADHAAHAAVLVSPRGWADGLAAGPLAAAVHAPVLMTSTTDVPTATMAEIQRAVPTGSYVYLLGGTAVISDDVRQALVAKGYRVHRFAGSTPAGTARAIANGVASVSTVAAVVEVTSTSYTDAVIATPAAIKSHGVVLLTNGTSTAPETTSWLKNHPGLTRYAVGAPAHQADPSATSFVGADPAATGVAVATKFFPAPSRVAFVASSWFEPGLVEAVRIGRSGPLLYTSASTTSTGERGYLTAHSDGIGAVELTGGSMPYYDVESTVQAALLA